MPPRARSEKPGAARARIRRHGAKINDDIKILYKKPIEEWDMEELARGRPRNKAGNFQGPRPTWITPLILKQASDKLRQLTAQELSVYAGDAVRVMANLMNEDGVDFDGKPLVSPAVRLDAAKYVVNQIIGTPKAQVEITGNVVLESLMAEVLINDETGAHAHPVIDAEVVDDTDDDEDDEDGGD